MAHFAAWCGLEYVDPQLPDSDCLEFGLSKVRQLDDQREVIGLLIHEVSTAKEPNPVEFELASEASTDDVANITVKQAAVRLGVLDLE